MTPLIICIFGWILFLLAKHFNDSLFLYCLTFLCFLISIFIGCGSLNKNPNPKRTFYITYTSKYFYIYDRNNNFVDSIPYGVNRIFDSVISKTQL